MLDDAADVVQGELGKTGVAVAGKEVFTVLPDGLVHVHARAVVAAHGLGHEGRGLTVGSRHVPDRVLHDLQPVGALHERGEASTDFALTRSTHFVVVDFTGHALLLQKRHHFGTDVGEGINRRNREVAALKGSAVAEVAAFKFDLRGPGGFFRADLKERVIRVGAPGDAVENEEFRFRTEESLITDPGGLQIRFGALCERARIAGIALAGVGFGDVAGQNQRVLFAERIHVSRVGVGHQDHVAGFNASPAGHRGAVKGLTVFEGFFRELMSGNGNVLFTAAGIGQAVIDKLNIVVFDHLQKVRGGRHILSPRIKGKCFTLSVAAGPEISSPASCCPKLSKNRAKMKFAFFAPFCGAGTLAMHKE